MEEKKITIGPDGGGDQPLPGSLVDVAARVIADRLGTPGFENMFKSELIEKGLESHAAEILKHAKFIRDTRMQVNEAELEALIPKSVKI